MGKGVHGELEGDIAAEADCERRSVHVPVVGIGNNYHVCGKLLLMLEEEVFERP